MVFSAITQSDILSESVGISRTKSKIIGFVICCFFAGMAGSIYAHFIGIITPHDFSIQAMLIPVAYVVIGGIGSTFGPVIGTTLLMILSHFLLRYLGFYELLIYGCIIVLMIRFMPQGIIGLPHQITSWINKAKEVRKDLKAYGNTGS